jgi:hypothetical protein
MVRPPTRTSPAPKAATTAVAASRAEREKALRPLHDPDAPGALVLCTAVEAEALNRSNGQGADGKAKSLTVCW